MLHSLQGIELDPSVISASYLRGPMLALKVEGRQEFVSSFENN